MSVCHGGNSDDLVSISAMTGTVAVNFCVYFNGLYIKKKDLLAILKKNLDRTIFYYIFVEFSNVQNCDRSSYAIQSNLVYKNV